MDGCLVCAVVRTSWGRTLIAGRQGAHIRPSSTVPDVHSHSLCFWNFCFGMQAALEAAKDMRLCRPGDCVVALHRIGNASGEAPCCRSLPLVRWTLAARRAALAC